jgi:predicted dehydrogenase
MAAANLPSIRWGIVGTGLISSWFVADLVLDRPDAKARHIIQAIGSSSTEKGRAFAKRHIPSASPTICGSYDELYNDPNVDVVYIGTPHAFHKANCLAAIAAGKHVLCEKAFTITAAEAQEVFDAARNKGVFIMEAMWTRFHPLLLTLQKMLHQQKVIGTVQRVFCDFGLSMDIQSLGSESRLKNPALGAGSLLDIGIYSLTWGLLSLDANIGDAARSFDIVASQSISEGVDISTSIILKYSSGSQAILTSTTNFKTANEFCRIEGTGGSIIVKGEAASAPDTIILRLPQTASAHGDMIPAASENDNSDKVYHFDKEGRGFYWEADAVALDIIEGRKESAIMPWAETIRVMKIMDEVRRQGGAQFPQDRKT